MIIDTTTTDRLDAPSGTSRSVDHLDPLESHAIFAVREVAAEAERPVLLFSGGKDPAVLAHLAAKAFRPGGFPFPVLHVDTGHDFDEVLAFRERRIAELGDRLIVASVQASIERDRVPDPGPAASRNRLQTTTMLDAIAEHGFDACFGGARRDEDKARAKEKERVRASPFSDWTELDIWQYAARESIELPSIYFAHRRPDVERDGMLLALSERVRPGPGEEAATETVRFRTVGDAACTGAVRSAAASVEEIVAEVAISRVSERGATRADGRFSESAMKDRKRGRHFQP